MPTVLGRLRFGVALFLPIATVAVLSTSASAYGVANWQAAFSGNFNNTPQGSTGFWGWCEFAGGVSAGNEADCSASFYFFPSGSSGASNGVLISQRISGTAWDMEASAMPPPPGSGLPADDFFITAGTFTLTGPFVGSLIRSGSPPPPGCTVTGSTATCTISPLLEKAGIYMADTGIPAGAGHFSLAEVFEILGIPVPPGNHIDVQVTQIT